MGIAKMANRNRRLARRSFLFERLELRTMLASDMVWNNPNWDSLPGSQPPMKNMDAYYSFGNRVIGLNMSSNKLVIGLNESSVELPSTIKGDFGLGERARVYESTDPLTPELVASIGRIPGVAYTSPVFVATMTGSELTVIDEFIVNLKGGVSAQEFFSALPDVASYRPLAGTTDQFVGRFADTTGRPAIDRANVLQKSDLVDWVQPNFYQNWQMFYTPNDPRFGNLWHLDNTGQGGGLPDADVDMPEAWDINPGGSPNIVIAVLDQGVQSNHPDLSMWSNPGEIPGDGFDNDGNGWTDDVHGWDFFENNNNPDPKVAGDNHGTPVAGVAAANGDNSLGVTGAAYRSRVSSMKIFRGNNYAGDANVAEAFLYAAGITRNGLETWNSAQVVNNSWGGGAPTQTLFDALAAGTARGATYLFSSGNGFDSQVSYPAAFSEWLPGVIAVGASSNLGTRSNYSNYGTALDFVAPSNGGTLAIDTTDRTGADGYASGDYTGTGGTGFGGTSSAAPLASGIAALALAQADVMGVTILPAELRAMMRNNTDLIGGVAYDINTGKHIEYGYGRINAATLLSGVGNAEISVVDTTRELPDGSTVGMGSIFVGQFVEKQLRIRNQGTQDLILNSIDSNAPFSAVNFNPTTLRLGESLVITLRFNPTLPGTYDEVLTINNNDPNESGFGLQMTGFATAARISGSVFEDFNNSATYDAFERGVAGSGFVYIDTNSSGTFTPGEPQATIDATGYYAFATIADGTYTVRVDLPGWTRTTPNSFYTVTLNGPDDFSLGNDFGFGKNNRYYAFVYEDLDSDGVFNNADLPLPNFVVNAGRSSYSSTDVPVDIFDQATSFSFLNIPAGPTISDLDVELDILHTWNGDMEISLTSPDNSSVILKFADFDFLDDSDNMLGTIFDDDATTPISAGTGPYTGRFIPDQLLSVFNGLSSVGTWQMSITDIALGDEGALLRWSLSFQQIGTSDANGWAILDLGNGPVSAVLELQPTWVYTNPTNGTHNFTANGAPIWGLSYGAVIPPLPPTDIQLDNAAVQENLPAGTFVGTLTSSDPNRFDTFTYSLVNGAGSTDNSRFEIIGDQLFALETFNYEANQNFSIRVRTTDSTGRSYTEVFNIAVVNVNEMPLSIALSPNRIDENSFIGRTVGTLSTTDTDFLTDFAFTYELVNGAGDTNNSAFAVNANSIVVNGPIDFEATPTMSIRVRSTDLGGLSVDQILTIDVNNVNEAPTIINLSNASLPENQPAGYEIGTLSNNDPDAGDSLVYSLVPGIGGDNNIMFQIVGDKLQSAVTFDYESRNVYYIRVSVKDRAGFSIERPFVINVTDLNEPPASISITSNRIWESNPVDSLIGQVTSTDADSGDTVSIAIVPGPGGEDNSKFDLRWVFGGYFLFNTEVVDYESKPVLSVLFEATDANGLTRQQPLLIEVMNSNEPPSSISLTPDSVSENMPIGTTIGKLVTADIDGDNVFNYQFVTGPGSDNNDLFIIVGDELRTNALFDFETKNSYTFRVLATDLGGLSVEQQLSVNISNANEVPSALLISKFSVDENAPIETLVGSFSTTDPDVGNTHRYTLVPGAGDTDNNLFTISGNNLVTRNIFNFESKNTYSIRVQTQDAGGLSLSRSFAISITDVNETPTAISLAGSTIPENSGPNFRVGVLSTSDVDAGDTFTYTLVPGTGGDDNGSFQIVGAELRAVNSFDFETKSNYTVRIRSTDKGGASSFVERSFSINVTNVNEVPTDIALSASSIIENAGVNIAVGTLSSEDADAGSIFTYALVSGMGDADNRSFTIDGTTLRASSSFDFETKSNYTVRVRSTDQGGLSRVEVFAITIIDINEVPTALTLAPASIEEGRGLNEVIGSLSTVDVDANNTFTYSFVLGAGSSNNSAFRIVGSTLLAARDFDFEAKSDYTVRVRTTDQDGLFLERALIINVLNVNEAPNDILLSATTIAENAGAGAIVGSLSTVDIDAANTFTYALVPGDGSDDNSAFQIVGSTLRAFDNFDFENRTFYNIRVRSSDQGGLSVEKGFTINVSNVNEGPLEVNITSSTIAENSQANSAVGVLSTVDPDVDSSFTYTLENGTGSTDNAGFQIVGSTLRTRSSLDFEAKPSHSVRIRSTDQGGLFTETVFVIAVTNVNERPTDILLSSTSIPENRGANALVGALSTIDVDAQNTFTYSFVSGSGSADNAAFQINGNSLRVINNLDFETKSSYAVRIRSVDQGGLFFEKAFLINVTNVNETPTDILISPSSIEENLGADALVGRFSTSDVDLGDTATFTLVPGIGDTDNAMFRLDGNALRARNNFDFETKSSYSIRVRVTDQDSEFIEKVLTINVVNANEAPTNITLSPATITENLAPDSVVGSFSTTDIDVGNRFTYTLVAGTGSGDNSAFRIDGASLIANGSFDFEAKSVYNIRVRSTDQNGLFVERSLAINVINANESPTDIQVTSTAILENLGANAEVGFLSTTDVDAGNTFAYTLVPGVGATDNASFRIVGDSLRSINSLDFETKSSYSIRIRSTDQGGRSVEKAFTIAVLNANDLPTTTEDTYWVTPGVPEILSVLDNDSDSDGSIDPKTVRIASNPSRGTATPTPDGKIQYAPNSGFRGDDSFFYTVRDNSGTISANTRVRVRVNAAPSTTPDSLSVKVNTPTMLDVLFNDTDPDSAIKRDTITIVSPSSRASLQVQPDGRISFSPQTDFLGITTFTYVVSDIEGRQSAPTDVTVRVVVSLYQNPINPYNVDGDAGPSPLDVLAIINLLNSRGPSLPVSTLSGVTDYVDVNGDNQVDPIDVLQLINFLNSRGLGDGEGEGSGSDTYLVNEYLMVPVSAVQPQFTPSVIFGPVEAFPDRDLSNGQTYLSQARDSFASSASDSKKSHARRMLATKTVNAAQQQELLGDEIRNDSELVDRVFEDLLAVQDACRPY